MHTQPDGRLMLCTNRCINLQHVGNSNGAWLSICGLLWSKPISCKFLQADVELDGHDEQPTLPGEGACGHQRHRPHGHGLRAPYQEWQRGWRVSARSPSCLSPWHLVCSLSSSVPLDFCACVVLAKGRCTWTPTPLATKTGGPARCGKDLVTEGLQPCSRGSSLQELILHV